MAKQAFHDIFRAGSQTYFNSAVFLPSKVRGDVFVLYAFVRTADDFVDRLPQDKAALLNFRRDLVRAQAAEKTGNKVVDEFVKLMRRRSFHFEWIDAFLKSMEMDTFKQRYNTLAETQEYMYGSAEVVGLMMARILDLPDEANYCAELLGRAMQYINFIRDIKEDLALGRVYLPMAELAAKGLDSLAEDRVALQQETFCAFIKHQIKRYEEWQRQAEEGYKYISWRYLVPIRTAADMYRWTARKIYQDPLIVYREKVKPSCLRIYMTLLLNLFKVLVGR
ncbi:MAG: phytoene/squalene synthase family protein [Candidatus Saganbacteria bacterium]|nr:phytoene/squalene synthase family protein [Candidatus Saganbacteria bacterium]